VKKRSGRQSAWASPIGHAAYEKREASWSFRRFFVIFKRRCFPWHLAEGLVKARSSRCRRSRLYNERKQVSEERYWSGEEKNNAAGPTHFVIKCGFARGSKDPLAKVLRGCGRSLSKQISVRKLLQSKAVARMSSKVRWSR
jgi:hypothetical protein